MIPAFRPLVVPGFESGFLTGHVLQQVAQGQAELVAVVSPGLAAAAAAIADDVLVHDGAGMAGSGQAGALEPGGPAALFTGRCSCPDPARPTPSRLAARTDMKRT